MSPRDYDLHSNVHPLRLIRGAPLGLAPSVLTIGTFDGIHVGHSALIARAQQRAAELKVEAGLLSFEPMPREVLNAANPPARLTNFRERWRLLEHSGLQRLHLLTFDGALRSKTGEDFMALLRTLGARAIIVGHDFRFGRGGHASAEWCAQEARHYGFEAEIIAPVLVAGERVSSGMVRSALAAGDLDRAARLLGRPYAMRGRVQRGEQLGRTLGYPTANLAVARRRTPLAGIFAVRVRGETLPGSAWPAVASLGTRPTVGGNATLLEVHLFDFNDDLYGMELEVEFVARLRDELKFESLGMMVEQMHRDAAAARAALG
ncbi:MAG: bifunctional riboflavin kinase/FAD synthetase [Steroidobacteraceae bacterium]